MQNDIPIEIQKIDENTYARLAYRCSIIPVLGIVLYCVMYVLWSNSKVHAKKEANYFINRGFYIMVLISIIQIVAIWGVGTFHFTYYLNFQKRYAGQKIGVRETGPWTYYHQNGKKAAQCKYIDGEIHGLWKSWYPDGALREKGHVADGRTKGRALYVDNRGKTGTWKYWDKTGNLIKEEIYNNNGQLKETKNYKPGEKPKRQETYPDIKSPTPTKSTTESIISP